MNNDDDLQTWGTNITGYNRQGFVAARRASNETVVAQNRGVK